MQIGRAFVRTAVFLSGTSFTNGSVVGGGKIFRQSAGHNGCQIVGTANLFLLPLQFGQIRMEKQRVIKAALGREISRRMSCMISCRQIVISLPLVDFRSN